MVIEGKQTSSSNGVEDIQSLQIDAHRRKTNGINKGHRRVTQNVGPYYRTTLQQGV